MKYKPEDSSVGFLVEMGFFNCQNLQGEPFCFRHPIYLFFGLESGLLISYFFSVREGSSFIIDLQYVCRGISHHSIY